MNKKLVSFAIAAMLTATCFARTDSDDKKPTIRQRKENQQDRIHQGVKSGQLTRGERRHIEKKEHALNQEERDMRKMDHGKLTKQDRKTLNQQQNQVSKQIYKDKHNKRKRG